MLLFQKTRRLVVAFAAACLAVASPVLLQSQAVLQFQIDGMKDKVATLGYYFGGKAFRADSSSVGPLGQFAFRKGNLQPGLYFIMAGGTRLFDFLVETPFDSFIIIGRYSRLEALQATNSPGNSDYFAFEGERKRIEEQIKAKEQLLEMVGRATKGDKDALAPLEKELAALYLSGDSLAIEFSERHASSMYGQMLRSVRPPAPPKDLAKKPGATLDRWLRAHYFDNTDFSDERLLYNNFWHSFFDGFFARHIAAQPDSLIVGIEEALGKMPRHGAFYRFAVLRLTQFFEQNEAPGADRVFVHLVDRHLKKDETPWLDIATLERLAYKADVHRPNLTGSLAVNFTLPDESGRPQALYDVSAPVTMLVFYSPLCDHCKEAMPRIYQTYLDYLPKGLKAVAVNTDKQHKYWAKFVGQQGWEWTNLASPDGIGQIEKQYAAVNLPVIYLLDAKKRIWPNVFRRKN
jgi:Thiol-disulfide isomerase and thioredoxins